MLLHKEQAFFARVYDNNSGIRQDERILQISGSCGLFVDEVVPIDNKVFYFHHGNPIAMMDEHDKVFRSSCGWTTKTTKERLNALGAYISQRNCKWFENGEPFKDDGEVIQSALGLQLYHRIDGWRGYSIPAFAVASASDTGNWSDSPCPSYKVSDELASIKNILISHRIKVYDACTQSSNLFCVKRHIVVKGIDYREAVKLLEEGNAFESTQYAHPPRDLSQK